MPPETRLPRLAPEIAGVDANAVERWLDALAERDIELHSFMILRNGSVAAEGWWKPYRADRIHLLYSLSKSFCSTAVGFAVAEGFFALEDKVVSFFPNDLPEDPSENLKNMTVHALLTIPTVHESEPDLRGPTADSTNWPKEFLSHPVLHAPGTHFVYNSAATYMCSVIVQQTTGQTVSEFLTPRLYEPLGIEEHPWQQSPAGVDFGGWGLSITSESIAKFGLLLLDGGVWNGTRVLPEGWVAKATSKQVSNGSDPENDWNQGYGYQYWRCRHNAFRGDGAFGQNCVVMPDQGVVLVTTGCVGDLGAVLSTFWEIVLSTLGNGASSSTLAARCENLDLAPEGGGAPVFSGRFEAEKGWIEISDGQVVLRTDTLEMVASFQDWIEREVTDVGVMAGTARWQDGALVARFRDIASPFAIDARCTLEGDKARVEVTQSGTFWNTERSFEGVRV